MPGAKAQPRFMGKAQPHEGRKRGTNHRTRLYTPAPAAYAGIDAYTHPNAGGTLKLDTKSQRATSLLMRQPGLPEGISKAKAANPGPGHYNAPAPDRKCRQAPRVPRTSSVRGCEWDRGMQQPGLPPSRSKWNLQVPAPYAYTGIDAYTHPNTGGTLSLDTKSQRATSLLICQPGLPEGISKAKAANPGPGHYERYDAQHVLLPVAPSYSQERSKREDSQIIVSPGLPLLKTKGNRDNPGPGSYDHSGSIGRQPLSTKAAQPVISIGTSKRPDTTQRSHQARLNDRVRGIGKQSSSKKRTAPAFSFGTSGRCQLIDM